MLKRNVIANFSASVWIAALTLLSTPIQIHLLGIEAFGLIGFIATLQFVVSVLDFGLSSTITREIAGDQTPGRRASQDLVRTAMTFYWLFALIIGIVVAALASVLARHWFRPDTIDLSTLAAALQTAALYLALRWPIALYSGVLAGVQRMDVLSAIRAGAATLRLAVGIAVLLIWPNLQAFLLWFAISALAEVSAYAYSARAVLPRMSWQPGLSWPALRAVGGFSSQMAVLAMLSMFLTQLDRILISKMLPLEQLGFYSLAYTAATGISIVISALGTALMPSFAASHEAGARNIMLTRYNAANQIMLYVTGLVLFSLVFFGGPLVTLWVNEAAAAQVWLPLALLAVGFWLSAAVSTAYTISIASRRPQGTLVISMVTGIAYVPLMYGLIARWGITGAAFAWLVLHVGYVVTIIPWTHSRLLGLPIAPWFTRVLLPYALLGLGTFGLVRLALTLVPATGIVVQIAALFVAALAYCCIGYILLDASVKNSLRDSLYGVLARA